MKKIKYIATIMLTMGLSLSMIGCTNSQNGQQPIVTPTIAPTVTVEPTIEPEPVLEYTLTENNIGLTSITVEDLKKEKEENRKFFLFIDNNENSTILVEKYVLDENFEEIVDENAENNEEETTEDTNVSMIGTTEIIEIDSHGVISSVIDEYSIYVPFYYINESELQDFELAELKTLFIDDIGTEIYSYYGIYAFKDNSLNSAFDGFTNISEDTTKETIYNSLVKFIFIADLFVNDYGIETISYQDVLQKMENKEEFILYIGRDTCPYCHMFGKSLEKVVADKEFNIPIYYLYTQSYKTNIWFEKENAQEEWDSLKTNLGIEVTPSVVHFVDGENIEMFNNYSEKLVSDFETKEEENEAIEQVYNNFVEWLVEINCIDEIIEE